MSPFIESPRFPGCPAFGYVFRPRYSTEKVAGTSGREHRFRFWEYPLHDCQVTVGPRMYDEIDEVLQFFHAVGGEYYGSRFKNYGEFKTCRPSQTPAATDQPMLATGATNEYQLIKQYAWGDGSDALIQNRIILKPIATTIAIADDDGPADPADYVLDETTGLVTFDAPPTGDPTWGGAFDIPMRFQGDFPITILARKAHSVTFMLEELRA